MNTPADRPARRRSRIRTMLGAVAALAAVWLVALGAAGGTYALWNDTVAANAGVIQLGPGEPTPPPVPPAQCTQSGHQVVLTYTHPESLPPQMYVVKALDGVWRGQVGYWAPDFHLDNGHVQQIPSLYPTGMEVGETRELVVTAYAEDPADTVIAQNTVWVTRQTGEFWVSCGPP